jgi:hypothetical protein
MAGSFDPTKPPGLFGQGMLGNLERQRRTILGGGLLPPPAPRLGSLASLYATPIKRRAFFSFHFDDVMRVNNVRQSWRLHNAGTILVPSFTDSSLWESKQLEGDEALKRLIREGVEHTSAICVLAGTDTWLRRWVRYEIARAIIDKRGLLTVYINGLKHHQRRCADPHGPNPLDYIAVGKDRFGCYHIYEKRLVLENFSLQQYRWEWQRYEDHTQSVTLPAYLRDPQPGYVMPLSSGAAAYCYAMQDGSKNIGVWIDRAAQEVGR